MHGLQQFRKTLVEILQRPFVLFVKQNARTFDVFLEKAVGDSIGFLGQGAEKAELQLGALCTLVSYAMELPRSRKNGSRRTGIQLLTYTSQSILLR